VFGMRSTLVYIHGVAFVDTNDMGGPGGRRGWRKGEDSDSPPPGKLFFPHFPTFSRLDLPSRYVLGAGSLLPPIPRAQTTGFDRTAVILGTTTGSLDTDLKFAASVAGGQPSGRLYARTLPSIPGAELAVRFGLNGPNFVIVQEGEPGLLALVAAIQEIRSGAAMAAVAGGFEAVQPTDRSGSSVQAGAVLVLLAGFPPAGTDDCYRVSVTRSPSSRSAISSPHPLASLKRLYSKLYDASSANDSTAPHASNEFEIEGYAGGSLIRLSMSRLPDDGVTESGHLLDHGSALDIDGSGGESGGGGFRAGDRA